MREFPRHPEARNVPRPRSGSRPVAEDDAANRALLSRLLERGGYRLNAVEAKDSSTELHCQRLAGLAHQLGMQAGLEPATLKGLVFGALLHDIGKIGVSDAILNKPGTLSREEWAEMRLHPLIGERICEPLASASQCSSIVRHHHERWDGAGYPDGPQEIRTPGIRALEALRAAV